MSERWYQGGLRFACTGCGDCCTGAPGHVWVNDQEITAIAGSLDMTPARFEQRYVRQVGTRRSLYEHVNGDCVFFDGEARRCRIYAVRPVQCRTWPFWADNLASEEAWARAEAVCPGSGEGDLIGVDTILAHLREHRAARRRK